MIVSGLFGSGCLNDAIRIYFHLLALFFLCLDLLLGRISLQGDKTGHCGSRLKFNQLSNSSTLKKKSFPIILAKFWSYTWIPSLFPWRETKYNGAICMSLRIGTSTTAKGQEPNA
jgi:hypothetical protein